MRKTINYREKEYEIFKSIGKKLTEFEGNKYKDLENGSYVSIDDSAYKIITSIVEFKNIQPKKDQKTEKNYVMNCIYLCEIDLSLNRTIDAIHNSIFLENFYYHNTKKDDSPLLNIDFNAVNFEKDCIITNDNYGEKPSIIFNQCHFEKKLKIRNRENSEIYIKEYEKEYEKAQTNKLKLDKLHILNCTVGDEVYLRIGFVYVLDFKLRNLKNPANAELNIGDCHFQNFELSNFRNLGKFKLFKINILDNEQSNNNEFNINNTSIGQADFQSLRLDTFNTIRLFDNIFSNIDYTNVTWVNKDIKVGQYHDDKKIKLEKKRDTYRVLKNVAQRNNDASEALKFYVEEMKHHKKIVNFCENKINFIILWFNFLTNDFGLNWFRPILWLLALAFLFYWLLLLTVNMEVWNNWGKFFEFLNPIHKTEFIAEGCWNDWTYFIDFLFRIVEGLLIYQIIQAFRKYGRKL